MYEIKDIFDQHVVDRLLERIEKLAPDTQAQWGKMNVAQMLAHCNVTYELALENKHSKPGFLKGLLLKWLVKSTVVGKKPYKKGLPTAPEFLVSDKQVFEQEKTRLINYIKQVKELGRNHFDGKASHSFGKLNSQEWNTMFYKHLDHHLTQFGV